MGLKWFGNEPILSLPDILEIYLNAIQAKVNWITFDVNGFPCYIYGGLPVFSEIVGGFHSYGRSIDPTCYNDAYNVCKSIIHSEPIDGAYLNSRLDTNTKCLET